MRYLYLQPNEFQLLVVVQAKKKMRISFFGKASLLPGAVVSSCPALASTSTQNASTPLSHTFDTLLHEISCSDGERYPTEALCQHCFRIRKVDMCWGHAQSPVPAWCRVEPANQWMPYIVSML